MLKQVYVHVYQNQILDVDLIFKFYLADFDVLSSSILHAMTVTISKKAFAEHLRM